MNRKLIAMLPLYILGMLIFSALALIICIVMFIPVMIYPPIVNPVRKQIMSQFTNMMTQMVIKQMKGNKSNVGTTV